jgi:zinc D-Ala-D-Ala dipeptidase
MKGLPKIKMTILSGLLFAGTGSALAASSLPPKPGILNNSMQLVVVVTDSWDNFKGNMQTFQRSSPNESWQATGPAWPIVVGQSGLAWENNLKSYAGTDPVKHEGDKKAPAGAFRLGPAFGFAPSADSNLKLSYIPVTSTTLCVDDPKSRYYGQIIDSAKVPAKDWNSAEVMHDHPQAYNQGMVVDYNTDGKMIGAGSCIFVHIHGDNDATGTVGCTAMKVDYLSKLLNWLDPKANPVLVQFPKDQYQKIQKDWNLPEIN